MAQQQKHREETRAETETEAEAEAEAAEAEAAAATQGIFAVQTYVYECEYILFPFATVHARSEQKEYENNTV